MPGPVPRRRFLGLLAGALTGVGAACAGSPGSRERADDAGVPEPSRRRYADHPDGFGDLWLPAAGGEGLPVVVLVHGGFWQAGFGLDLMDGLAASVAGAGWAAWNIEYRRVGGGGGYPQTFDDVAAAVDHLAAEDLPVDLDRVAIVGHSAGGHLAAWAASRTSLPAGSPWADPAVRPGLVVPQAGVLDLVGCAEEGVGGTACPDLVGGTPEEVPDRYAVTSPLALVPPDADVVAVHGSADGIVPVSQSERYVAAVREAGGRAELRAVAGADHFDVIDPGHKAWQVALDVLDGFFAP